MDWAGHHSNVGPLNGFSGSGPDFLFQADGNQSITSVPINAPEPTTLLLLGFGLAGVVS